MSEELFVLDNKTFSSFHFQENANYKLIYYKNIHN